jgi:hypothetical protein
LKNTRLPSWFIIPIIAITLSLLSSVYQRYGPEVAIYGNVCGPSQDQFCLRPVLNAGFPLGFLFDDPAISVRDQLTPLIEDEFRGVPFMVDAFFYGSIIYLIYLAVRRRMTMKDLPA